MTVSPPGTRLHTLLARWAPEAVLRHVIEPGIADLQYEAERAPTLAERRQIILRGHLAIGRALLLSIEPGGGIRAVLALSALCAVGTLLVTAARTAHADGRVLFSAFIAPGMLAPVLLRLLGTTSWRRLFLGSLLVALLTPVYALWLAAGPPLWMRAARVLISLPLFAPMAAAAATVAGPRQDTPPTRAVRAVSVGSGIATMAFLVAQWRHDHSLSIELEMTPFYVVLFGALFALTLLPLLLVARTFIARPALLAVAALICSPAPVIAAAYIDHGSLTACLDALRHTPLSFAAASLPFVAGAVAIGWHFPSYGQPLYPSLRDS